MVHLGRSWDVDGSFLSVYESYRILEYLGGDDPLLILCVNRSRSIGVGAYILGHSGLLGCGAVLSFPSLVFPCPGRVVPQVLPRWIGRVPGH